MTAMRADEGDVRLLNVGLAAGPEAAKRHA